MSKLSLVSSKQMVKIIETIGFEKLRQNGSHARYGNGEGKFTVVPMHNRDLPRGLIRSILNDVNLTVEDYETIRKNV